MTYSVGSLVKARGREWVVLPESEESLLILRPLGGTDREIAGVLPSLEEVEPAQFDLPDRSTVGDERSARLLRDGLKLGFRSSAGPFRSFGRLAVEPRPYQLVPLMLAMRLDPVRLLIADDVGIGKTVEACLIARELLDRGEIQSLAVLCPPHLAEQWQTEMAEKFHIDAKLVLSSTAARLERDCVMGESLFDRYPFLIVSIDFIKSERRCSEFLRSCPEMIVVDEAHTCAQSHGSGAKQMRFELISQIAKKEDRHIVLVTATPHSGKEDAFRSLLTLLDPGLQDLPEDLSGQANEAHRRNLARHMVQRRRGDIRHYLKNDTPFPERFDTEATFKLSGEYKAFFEKVLAYVRETVKDDTGTEFHRRIRWWSALALLRSIASSPAAAVATLKSRSACADSANQGEVDELGRRTVMDVGDLEQAETADFVPGSDIDENGSESLRRRKLAAFAKEAETLKGPKDLKLQGAVDIVKDQLKRGISPIVFCRFIPTAEYLAENLREKLGPSIEVESVTGKLSPEEREDRVNRLGSCPKRVLVCTDCLSEGINLQEHFDGVIHYDLSWNPTRHEQREGRVDRYGQPKREVRVVTYYGLDNQVDGIVLDTLIRKHKAIRTSLGISVPVPIESEEVVEAIFEGLLLREDQGSVQNYLPGFEAYFKPKKEDLYSRWESTTEKEKRSRTVFAQEGIKPEEVAHQLEETRRAIGSGVDVGEFMKNALTSLKAKVSGGETLEVDLSEATTALKDMLGRTDGFRAKFSLPVQDGELYLHRTHPLVENTAAHVVDLALSGNPEGPARCGAIRTDGVTSRTTLLLVRFRFHLITTRGDKTTPLLVEDCRLMAFRGTPEKAEWLTKEEAESIFAARSTENIYPEQAMGFVGKILDGYPNLAPHLDQEAKRLAEEQLESHRSIRKASRDKGVSYRVQPQLPPDLLGIYIYLPEIGGNSR